MNGQCKGICKRYSESHCNTKGSGYQKGLNYCSFCKEHYSPENIFISPGGRKLCPCCKTPVRTKPKYKSKIIMKIKIKN